MARPILFDAVLFDLDGTLVATDRFWVPAARTGCRRAFRELGIEREIPSAEEWMSLVGYPFPEGLGRILPDLGPEARRRVGETCLEEEVRQLSGGGAALMPGAEALLAELAACGVKTAIASNCSRTYLDHMLDALELGRRVHEARCLDSPGVASKSDMLADLLQSLGTRSAVMVGDRRGDRDAAWDNGLPHVHCRFGFATGKEEIEAEAVVEDLGQLPGELRRRTRWIAHGLEEAGVLRALGLAPGSAPAIGITGRSAAGKTLFARDAARLLAEEGIPSRVVALDDFLRAGIEAAPEPDDDPLGSAFDLATLVERVLAPHARGEPVRIGSTRLDPDQAILLEGPFLLDPRLRTWLERVIHLHVPEDVSLRRVAARDGRAGASTNLALLRRRHLPAQAAHEERFEPAAHADLVLEGTNPLGGRGPGA